MSIRVGDPKLKKTLLTTSQKEINLNKILERKLKKNVK